MVYCPWLTSWMCCLPCSWTGSLAAMVALALYGVACVVDPGTLTARNVEAYASMYDQDGVLYSLRSCGTCNIQKPARSKHCRVCNR